MKKADPKDDKAVTNAEAEFQNLMRECRDAANKAQNIEDAVFDLKAVKPNKKAQVDTRTPNELLDLIERKGLEVAEAIATLRAI